MFTLSSGSLLLAQAAADSWSDAFFGLDPDDRFALIIVAVGCTTGIIISSVGMVTSMIRSMHRRRLEINLKQELLDRGLSVEEIERIVAVTAVSGGCGTRGQRPPTGV